MSVFFFKVFRGFVKYYTYLYYIVISATNARLGYVMRGVEVICYNRLIGYASIGTHHTHCHRTLISAIVFLIISWFILDTSRRMLHIFITTYHIRLG